VAKMDSLVPVILSGICFNQKELQVNMLIYTMGDAADNIFFSPFGLPDEDEQK